MPQSVIPPEEVRLLLFFILTLAVLFVYALVEYRANLIQNLTVSRASVPGQLNLEETKIITVSYSAQIAAMGITALWASPVPLLVLDALIVPDEIMQFASNILLSDYHISFFFMSIAALVMLWLRFDVEAHNSIIDLRKKINNWIN